MKKQWILSQSDPKQLTELQQALGIPLELCQLLVQRGITTAQQAEVFFHPDSSQIHSPFLLHDMDKAVERLQLAIENQERILLYGDYDVDGTTAVALLYSFLAPHHSQLDYYIPDRYKEGYGLSMAGIDYAQQNGIGLLITLDCGIKAMESIKKAKAYGIDVIVCDHHLPGDQLPDAFAILDPKQPDCSYPYPELCGAGVAFKLAQAYALYCGLPEAATESLLDLLVIAIACDIVPLTGENRALAYLGLQRLQHSSRLGIRALIRQSNRNGAMSISNIVFGLGPMINAAGRLGDARQAVRLLLADDIRVAADLAKELGRQNELRKTFDKKIALEAQAMLESQMDWEKQKSIVLYQPHWHKGVVGIAAARMVEKYHRPCIILTESGGEIVGSARSIPGFDIHVALQHCEDLLVNFGGHRYAAGLSLAPEQLAAFQLRFEEVVQKSIDPQNLSPEILVTAELALDSISPEFWNQLKRFAPFGPGNRNPIFVSRYLKDTGHSRLLKQEHLRLSVRQDDSQIMTAIAFGQGALFETIRNHPFDLCYTLQENHWQDRVTLQMVVKDIIIPQNLQ